MAEVKMDDDGTLQYIPIIAEADGLDAEGNGCVKIAHHKFEHIPGNVTKSWRRSLRLLSEFEVVSILQKVKKESCSIAYMESTVDFQFLFLLPSFKPVLLALSRSPLF